MPLKQLRFENLNMPIATFWESVREPYVLDPPYQRGDVWEIERRRNLIKSLLIGLPIGVVFVNLRSLREANRGYVVDGKQRITTIQMFARDEFAVPASWFSDIFNAADIVKTETLTDMDYVTGVRFSGLSLRVQRFFGGVPIAVYRTQVQTEQAEREMYQLINFGGVPQTDEDRARVELYEPRLADAADLLQQDPALSLRGAIVAAVERRGGSRMVQRLQYEEFLAFMGLTAESVDDYEANVELRQKVADLQRAAADINR